MSATRQFWGREWGTSGRCTFEGGGEPAHLFSFNSKADRDAWVALADGVPRNDCGARDPLTAAEARRYPEGLRWLALRWASTHDHASEAAKDHLRSVGIEPREARVKALPRYPGDADLGLEVMHFELPPGCPLSAVAWDARCTLRVREIVHIWQHC